MNAERIKDWWPTSIPIACFVVAYIFAINAPKNADYQEMEVARARLGTTPGTTIQSAPTEERKLLCGPGDQFLTTEAFVANLVAAGQMDEGVKYEEVELSNKKCVALQ